MSYCPNYIVRQGSVSWQEVYCDRGLASWGVLRHGQPGHDTAQEERVGRAGRWAQARGLCTPRRATGPAGCVLGALSLF